MEKSNQFEKYLSRRLLTEQGWVYFCRICGEYKPENQFYKRSDTPYKIDSRCKEHYTRKNNDDDGEMDYLKLNPLTEDDFIETQRFLERIGYSYNSDKPIWKQFNERHGIKSEDKDN